MKLEVEKGAEIEMVENTCREMTLVEELEYILAENESRCKERVLEKAKRMEEICHVQESRILYCHDRIHQLEQAVVELSIQCGALRKQAEIERGAV